MKVLAEALAARKAFVEKIGRLDDDIARALVYEEGEGALAAARAEVGALEDALTEALDELQAIENDIRAANNAAFVRIDGKLQSLSEAIVLRDRLKTEHSARNHIADAAEAVGNRKVRTYGREIEFTRRNKDEVPIFSALDPTDAREKADAVAKRLRLLDVEIQKVNWSWTL